MRLSSKWLWTALACAASAAALGACGDDDPAGSSVFPSDAGIDVEAGQEGGTGDADADAGEPPVPSAYGLDERPVNTTCLAPARPSSDVKVGFDQVFADVSFQNGLMAMAQIPGDASRWFAALRNGLVVSFPVQGASGAPDVVADVPQLAGMPIQAAGEGGLLGFAFHPDFASVGQLFVSWTTTGGPADMRSTVGRLTSSDGGATFSSYETIVAPFDQPASNHNGGGVAFGPDGYLYLGFGDGGSSNDAFGHGQNLEGMFAKILRIDVDTPPAAGETYVIPPDNPFAGGGGEPATYAWGLRNPFRISFDRDSGELWVGDVGQNAWEEIDVVELGGNYGWPCREGTHDYLTEPPKCPDMTGLIDPVYEYAHQGSASVTGGVVYRGTSIEGFAGTYVFGDYATKELFALDFDPVSGEAVAEVINPEGPFAGWSGFAQDAEGEVYALSLFPPAVYKLVATEEGTPVTFPQKLSETGCFDPSDPAKPAGGLVPYGVNAPLWSDGAGKERYMALPEGGTIEVGEDGDFVFPIGTVLVKTFWLAGKRVETRLFVRHDDGEWGGYSYEWDDDQSDAMLLPSSKTKEVGGVSWLFPSRANCVQCHTEAAGRSLGPEVGQLNGDHVYPSTNRIANQLATLDHIGLFAEPLAQPPEQLVAYPDPSGSGAVEGRARAYLHANCSHCHRPNGPGRSDMDLRFGTAFADTKTCGVDPQDGDLGIEDAKIVAPGDPARSVLIARPDATDANRMPPLASDVVDTGAIELLESWVEGLTACP